MSVEELIEQLKRVRNPKVPVLLNSRDEHGNRNEVGIVEDYGANVVIKRL